MELLEYAIRYQPRGAIKARVLADFIAEMGQEPLEVHEEHPVWTVYVDGTSNKGVGLASCWKD